MIYVFRELHTWFFKPKIHTQAIRAICYKASLAVIYYANLKTTVSRMGVVKSCWTGYLTSLWASTALKKGARKCREEDRDEDQISNSNDPYFVKDGWGEIKICTWLLEEREAHSLVHLQEEDPQLHQSPLPPHHPNHQPIRQFGSGKTMSHSPANNPQQSTDLPKLESELNSGCVLPSDP